MEPVQLELDWSAPATLSPAYPNRLGWMLAWLRGGTDFGWPVEQRMAIWGTTCGHVMVGVRGGVA